MRLHQVARDRFRDECLNAHMFVSLHGARRKTERWRIDYNEGRPHDSLANLTPMEFSEQRADNTVSIVSVPREPMWRILNVARGPYLRDPGNTPGHVQHWSTRHCLEILQRKVDVISVRTPLPWTLALCKPRKGPDR